MDWKNQLDNIQNKIKGQLFARKIDDLEGVYKLMAEFDTNNYGYLDRDQFQKFLQKIGVFLTTQELRSVYDKYDYNKDGRIAYSEFISLIRENMSQKRIQIVRNAFQFLDSRHEGCLQLSYLMQLFNANNHPRVRTRQKTNDQVRHEFANAISKRSQDGQTINENEFLNYYADVNATQPQEKEEYFVDVVVSTWGITSGVNYVSHDRLEQLEITLYEKIRQKTVTKQDEGKTARQAFKYFDQADRGIVDVKQFGQVLAKFGCVFSDKEIQALFNKYDVQQTGKLCYDEFCGLIAVMGSGKQVNLNPVFEITRQPPTHTLNKLKDDLIKIGQHSVRRMVKSFMISDKNKTGKLNRQEYQWAMKDSGLLLTKTEYDNLYKYFDKNYDDQVSFHEFISFFRSQLSENRNNKVLQAWNKLTSKDTITIDEIKQQYDPSRSLDVYWGRRSVAEAYKDFALQFDQQKISFQDFIQYHTDISGLVDDDSLFDNFVQGVWRL